MCAVSRVPENVSRTSVAFGVASLVILLTGFVTGSWVTTREPYRIPDTDVYTAAAFRIGLWKVCPTLRKINSTLNFRSLSCKYVRYTSDWDLDLAKEDLGMSSDVYFTQSFVTKMRWCTPLVGISLCLMLAGCVFSFSGHFYKDQKTLIASSLHTLAGLVLAAGLFVFASVLSDSFSPVAYRSADGDAAATASADEGFDGELRSDYDYRYGWSFVACSLAFLASEASAVFTITAYFRRLEDSVRYTAVDRKPSPDTPPPSLSAAGGCDRPPSSSACSADGCADSPDAGATDSATFAADRQPAHCGGNGVDCFPNASSGAAADASGCSSSKTPPDICPPKIGGDDGAVPTIAVATALASACKQSSYCSATLSHPPGHKQHVVNQHARQHVQHYRQTLAVGGGGGGGGYEVDASKPCTCASSGGATTTRRYATIAGVARHNGGKQYTTTTTTALAAAAAVANNSGNGKRSAAAAIGLASIKEAVSDHHHNGGGGGGGVHHRKPADQPTRRLKGSVGGYVVPQTPIAALEALDCPPVTDPRLVMPSSV